MTDIEKKALIQQLEGNATCYELLGEKELPRLLRCAAAALTPPEGYVLVPVDCLHDLADDAEAYVKGTEFRPSRVEQKMESVYTARGLLAAREKNK